MRREEVKSQMLVAEVRRSWRERRGQGREERQARLTQEELILR